MALLFVVTHSAFAGYLYGWGTEAGEPYGLYRVDRYIGERIVVRQAGNDLTELNSLAYVPEPATLFLLGLGGFALRRKKTRV